MVIFITNSSFATASIAPQNKTIIINNTSYTLNVCDTNDLSALWIKVSLSLKWKPITAKKRVITQVKLLQTAWAKACINTLQPSNTTTIPPQIISTNNTFSTITNPTFLDTLSESQRNTAKERARVYTTSVEGIIDSMITQGVLTSTDKSTIKWKIALTYVNDCKKINWLTNIKQRYDWNKKRIRNDLTSIDLNVSTCEDTNYIKLFSTSYKHVFIHELWHYIYYLRDKDTSTFENICRWMEMVRKDGCTSDVSFYSKYAMTSSEEDYAETFAYWYQSTPPENSAYNKIILGQKAWHFDSLFGK
jgi:hypothetical protein